MAFYSLMNMKVNLVSHTAVHIIHRIENRYFLPSWGSFELVNTKKQFIRRYKKTLKEYYENQGWKVEFDKDKRNINLS